MKIIAEAGGPMAVLTRYLDGLSNVDIALAENGLVLDAEKEFDRATIQLAAAAALKIDVAKLEKLGTRSADLEVIAQRAFVLASTRVDRADFDQSEFQEELRRAFEKVYPDALDGFDGPTVTLARERMAEARRLWKQTAGSPEDLARWIAFNDRHARKKGVDFDDAEAKNNFVWGLFAVLLVAIVLVAVLVILYFLLF
ncbi:hypothetical protein [Mesorhizobium sp. IMUNJ 23232]|uniref:hypothetical protein n=1 Tax=Mesorhizobium sp. IMUNJ 23232 TaxID=3376064 RepID=UPI0037B117C9